MHTILSKIVAGLMVVASLLGIHSAIPVQAPQAPSSSVVGAVLPTATGVFETSLAAPITATATSMALSANAVRGGGSISGYTCFTVDEGSPQAEITCGTVASTAVSSLTRGVSYADGITAVTANKFQHRRGANVKITDFPILQILKAQNNGEATYENALKYQTEPASHVDRKQLADVGYIQDAVVSGGVDASSTVKGVSKLSTSPASPSNPISVGDNDTRVPTQGENDALVGNNTDIAVGTGNKFATQTGLQHNAEKYAADSGSNDTYVITLSPAPASYTSGMVVYFKANTANTGTATLNVNGLGDITIVKGVNTPLADNDIAAGQFVTVIDNGTNFILQNPTNNIVTGAVSSFVGAPFSSGNINTTQNVDTTYTSNFTAKNVTLYYVITGNNAGTDIRTSGIATFDGTSLVSNLQFVKGGTSTATITQGTLVVDNSALTVGSGANSIAIALTVNSVSSTQFVVRAAFTLTGSAGGNNATAKFYPVATQ